MILNESLGVSRFKILVDVEADSRTFTTSAFTVAVLPILSWEVIISEDGAVTLAPDGEEKD